jgi:hypothetical protein
MDAEQAFEKYAKEHLLEPNHEYGSAYMIARYWFMLGWDSRHETMRDAIVPKGIRNPTGASSWEGKVDTQSGAFTQDEIDNATAWR